MTNRGIPPQFKARLADAQDRLWQPTECPNQPDATAANTQASDVSPAMRERLQRCFERGKEVIRREKPDHDYAHTMFAECVLTRSG